ncbi:MAG: M20 family metallopeptidase, partial [Bacteroidota bacterium]
YQTAKYVANKLQGMGLEPEVGIAGTGLRVFIKGQNPDTKTIALRADMDALPIVEANEVEYRSQNEGVMHACGHDVHTASLLGTAQILHQLRDHFEGTIQLIFQPGEEKIPGGASLMIKEGVLEAKESLKAPNGILGQHVMPFLPVGQVGFRSGQYMASADEIYVTVQGKGGHAALPHRCIDPVLISAHLIVALQQIISRKSDPIMPSVLSFGKIIAEGATNVIPNEVKIAGTFRTFDEEWRKEAHQEMKKIAKGLVEGMGGKVDFDIQVGYPHLNNDPELTQRARQAAENFLGVNQVVDLDLWMAAEDFAFYSQHMDACFYRLGTRNEDKGIISSVHTPTFDIDEDAMEIGVGLMSWLALSELNIA